VYRFRCLRANPVLSRRVPNADISRRHGNRLCRSEKIVVLKQKFNGAALVLANFYGAAQEFGLPMAAVHSDEFHGRAHTGLVRLASGTTSLTAPSSFDLQADRKTQVGELVRVSRLLSMSGTVSW